MTATTGEYNRCTRDHPQTGLLAEDVRAQRHGDDRQEGSDGGGAGPSLPVAG
ncbi:hypothetical protein [Peterkaempfera griseoplana]|uniref:hypothetical protein n=1 Tax=Peterkaempfera griseoplana TaxID=66896 RepID=UPI000A4195E4|nr:hypothetical protein [Peterkaempfera griseoplana]